MGSPCQEVLTFRLSRIVCCCLDPLGDLDVGSGVRSDVFTQKVTGALRKQTEFIHSAVIHRMDFAIRGWRNWVLEGPCAHLKTWLRPDLVPLSPFLSCEPCLTPGGSGVLVDPDNIDEKFKKAWLPFFCRGDTGSADMEAFRRTAEGLTISSR